MNVEFLTQSDYFNPGFEQVPDWSSLVSENLIKTTRSFLAGYVTFPELPPSGADGTWTMRYVTAAQRWAMIRRLPRSTPERVGTTQVLFAAPETTGRSVWYSARKFLALEGWMDVHKLAAAGTWPNVPERETGEALIAAAVKSLAALAAGDRVVNTGLPREETSQVIALLLGALPDTLARATQWSDVHLEAGVAVPCVTGERPEDWGAVTGLFPTPQVGGPRLSAENVKLLDWLIREAAAGRTPVANRPVKTYDELLNAIDEAMPPGPETIAKWMKGAVTPAQLTKIRANPGLLEQWVLNQQRDPMSVLYELRNSYAFEDVFDIYEQTAPESNVFGLPSGGQPAHPSWLQLAPVMRTKLGPDRFRDFIFQQIKPGRLLHSRQARLDAGNWLRQMGLTPETEPEFFPATARSVVNQHQIDQDDEKLRLFVWNSEEDRVGALNEVLFCLRSASPILVTTLMAVSVGTDANPKGSADAIGRFDVQALLHVIPKHKKDAAEWLRDWAIQMTGVLSPADAQQLLARLVPAWQWQHGDQIDDLRTAALCLTLDEPTLDALHIGSVPKQRGVHADEAAEAPTKKRWWQSINTSLLVGVTLGVAVVLGLGFLLFELLIG